MVLTNGHIFFETHCSVIIVLDYHRQLSLYEINVSIPCIHNTLSDSDVQRQMLWKQFRKSIFQVKPPPGLQKMSKTYEGNSEQLSEQMTREARDATEGNSSDSDSNGDDGEDGLIRPKRQVRATENLFMQNTLSNNEDWSHNPMESAHIWHT